MECPALMPPELNYCQELSSDEELFKTLTKHIYDTVLFFESACDDETWSQDHPRFMRQMLRWISRQFVNNKIPMIYAKKVVQAIRRHRAVLQPYFIFRSLLHYNVNLVIQNKTHWVNSLLFAVSSPFFRERFQLLCWEYCQNRLLLPEGDESLFNQISEYVYTGQVEGLWKLQFEKQFQLMKQAMAWELTELSSQCVDVMKRYLARGNVIENILQAHQENLTEWKHECYRFFNKEDWGLNFIPKGPKDFAIEFLDFKTETLQLFDRFAPFVTHVAFRGILNERPTFNAIINSCPNLIGLDISRFQVFSDYLAYIPEQVFEMVPMLSFAENLPEKLLEMLPAYASDFLPLTLLELDISACAWLKPAYLKFIFLFCSELKKLNLSGNTQLKYDTWGNLNRLKYLLSLDLSHCTQLTNLDMRAIAMACPMLDDIVLEDCPNITDMGVMEVIDRCRFLSRLNLDYTPITNKTLVALSRASDLTHLSIKGNETVTERGIAALARTCPALKILNVQGCRLISEKTMAKFQRIRPLVEVIL